MGWFFLNGLFPQKRYCKQRRMRLHAFNKTIELCVHVNIVNSILTSTFKAENKTNKITMKEIKGKGPFVIQHLKKNKC